MRSEGRPDKCRSELFEDGAQLSRVGNRATGNGRLDFLEEKIKASWNNRAERAAGLSSNILQRRRRSFEYREGSVRDASRDLGCDLGLQHPDLASVA